MTTMTKTDLTKSETSGLDQGLRCQNRQRLSRRARLRLLSRGECRNDRLPNDLVRQGDDPVRRAHESARPGDFHKSAFLLLSGDNVELWTGDELQHCEVAHAGDYLFIPANVPHIAVNRGSEPAVCIGCRNEPTAQESVVMYLALDAKVP